MGELDYAAEHPAHYISCDVCSDAVHEDDIHVIPDERTVCERCYTYYHRDPEKFDEED